MGERWIEDRKACIAASASVADAAARLGTTTRQVYRWVSKYMPGFKWSKPPRPNRLRTYSSWRHARARCRNPKEVGYDYCGAKGIEFDPRWDDFAVFLADMGERPAGTSLDRIDTSGNYTPSNCRWASMKVQQRNRTNNRYVEYNGERLTLAELAERVGHSRSRLYGRLFVKGMSIDEAISAPVRLQNRPRRRA